MARLDARAKSLARRDKEESKTDKVTEGGATDGRANTGPSPRCEGSLGFRRERDGSLEASPSKLIEG
jgi:hypothetical protein